MTLPRLPLTLFVFALLFVAIMAGPFAVAPPPVRSGNAEAQFDAGAARAALARVLGDEAPHPIDTDRQDVTRTALLAEIRALGVEPEVRESFACRPNPNNPLIDCMMVRNILFSVGPEEGPAVLAATHYDSVPAAPGAADAGIGIAVWLEIARHLVREQSTLTRRVVFLITDGEEPALIGAYVFAQEPLMRSVEALVNLEARGTRGPALFFETNQPNADAIHAFSGARRGMANSIMADVYRMLPNNTDVTEFMRPDLDVVNIAISEGLENYHTPRDSLANLDPRSLQHMGDIALSVTRRFANEPDRGRTGTLIYTDIAGRAFVSAPSWAGQAVLVVVALLALAMFWRSGAPGRWRALAAPLLALIGAGASAFVVGALFETLRPAQDFWFAHPEAARAWCTLLALAALAGALLFGGRTPAQIGAAGVLWFALAGLAISAVAPGITILFALPAAPYALGALISVVWAPARAVGAAVAAVFVLVLWAPTLALVEVTLGYAMPYAFAMLATLAGLLWLGALSAANVEARWRWPALTVTGVALVAVIAGLLAPSYSSARPQPLNIQYFYDASANEARILAGSARRALPAPLGEAAAFAPQLALPGDRQPSWAAPVAVEPVPRPTLSDITAREQAGRRFVAATLRMNGAYRAVLRIPRDAAPERIELIAATGGIARATFAETTARGAYFNLACQGRACDGAQVLIELPAGPAAEAAEAAGAAAQPFLTGWLLIGQSPGAQPEEARAAIAARPTTATPIQFGDGVLTLERLGPAAP